MTKSNLLIILVAMIISGIIQWTSDLTGVGMAWLVMMWMPLIIAFIGIILYFIWKKIHESSAYIATILTVIFLVAFAVRWRLTDFTI